MTQPSNTDAEKSPSSELLELSPRAPIDTTHKPEVLGVIITRWELDWQESNSKEVDAIDTDDPEIPDSNHESLRDDSQSHHVSTTSYRDGSNDSVVSYPDGAEIRTAQNADGTTTVMRLHFNGEIFSALSFAAPPDFHKKVSPSHVVAADSQTDQ